MVGQPLGAGDDLRVRPNYALVCHQHHYDSHADESLWHWHRDGRWPPDGFPLADAVPPTASHLRYPGTDLPPDPLAPF